MSNVAPYKKIVASRGPAVGRIRRINHLQIVVLDMEASLRFYRDLLGFTVIRTFLAECRQPIGRISEGVIRHSGLLMRRVTLLMRRVTLR